MQRSLKTAAVACALVASTGAMAGTVELINFDNITTQFAAPVPDHYDHLHWIGWGVVAGDYVSAPEGLFNAVVSPDYVAYPTFQNRAGDPFALFGGTSFTFQDAYFGAWSHDGLAITVTGLDRGGNVLDQTTFAADTLGPVFETFGWKGLYAVLISATGGTENANDGGFDSTLFAIDNVRISDVPEPGALALFGLGLGALALRRRAA